MYIARSTTSLIEQDGIISQIRYCLNSEGRATVSRIRKSSETGELYSKGKDEINRGE